jgi:hypothetical protein
MMLRRFDTVATFQELGLGRPQRPDGDSTIPYV